MPIDVIIVMNAQNKARALSSNKLVPHVLNLKCSDNSFFAYNNVTVVAVLYFTLVKAVIKLIIISTTTIII